MPYLDYTGLTRFKEKLDQEIGEMVIATKTITPHSDNVTLYDAAEDGPVSLTIQCNLDQDLHGYNTPWIGGTGRNILPMMLSSLKTINTSGTWNGNVYTNTDVTFTVIVDNNDNILGVRANGTASANRWFNLFTGSLSISSGYKVNGLPSAGSNSTFLFRSTMGDQQDITTNDTTSLTGTCTNFSIKISSGYTASNLLFTPMIYTGSNTSFEPYTNICPAIDYSSINLTRTGENIFSQATDTMFNMVFDTNNGSFSSNNYYDAFGPIKIKPNTTYTVRGYSNYNSGTIAIACYTKGGQYIGSSDGNSGKGYQQATIFSNSADVAYIVCAKSSASTRAKKETITLCEGSEPVNETYDNRTYNISLPSYIGEVYGGELIINNDGTGTFISRYAAGDLGTVPWTYDSSGYAYGNASNFLHMQGASSDDVKSDNILCSILPVVAASAPPDGTIGIGLKTNKYLRMRWNGMPTTTSTIQSALSGYKLYYLLDTPKIYELTIEQIRTLLKYNFIYSDIGNISSLKYCINNPLGKEIANIQSDIAKCKNGVMYGFHIDGSESDPEAAVTYVADAIGATPAKMNFTNNTFDYGSWKNAFFMPKPCMLKYDGTVDYYLDPNNYGLKLDGTASDVANTSYDGNAMMEWGRDGKKIWYTIVPDFNDNTSATVYIADHQVDERFHAWSFINNYGQMVDHFYTACYFGTLINFDESTRRLRSLSGQLGSNRCMNKTAAQERQAAKYNNLSEIDIWDVEIYADIILINILLILIGKSLDTQGVFGQGLHTDGTDTTMNYFTFGQHDNKGLFYGTNSGSATTYTNAVKVFGMENWWGYAWRRFVGLFNVRGKLKYKMTRGTEDGSSVSDYVISTTDSDYDGYLIAGNSPSGNGYYIKKMEFDENQMLPSVTGGTSADASHYYCDAYWGHTTAMCAASHGGDSATLAKAGAFVMSASATISTTRTGSGAMLSCKPVH